jgi:ABC-type nitrate/sulfonate/bicarbonate transport system substrate-binding protein
MTPITHSTTCTTPRPHHFRRLVATLTVAAVVAAACGSDDDGNGNGGADGGLREVTLMLNWTPNTHHGGIYVAQEQGLYREAGLDVTIVEPAAVGADQAVGTGSAEFGISQAESVLPARAAGVPVVSIATLLPDNDSSLMALAATGIERPSDLEGTTYGGFGGALETELISTLVECDGGDPDQVEFVEVGNIDYLTGLEQGRFDFVWVFEGWDALRARELSDVEIGSIRFIDHEDCIPNWYTPLVITNEELLADDPELVEAFLAATTEGYQVAIDDPAAAAEALLAGAPELDADLVRASAEYHSTRYAHAGERWGVQDVAVWERFEAFARQAGLMDDEVDVDATFTNDHLPAG